MSLKKITQKQQDYREELAEYNEEMIFYDGFEDALIGVLTQFGRPPIALYDREKCIKILMEDGMDEEGAEEFFSFNSEGSYVGDSTPAFAIFVKKG